jgi:hypothetical protein
MGAAAQAKMDAMWLVDRFDRYEEILDRRIADLMAKLLKK